MKSLLMLCFAFASCATLHGERVALNGAGGSFPAPLYQAWSYAYTQEGSGAHVNYQSVGSSAGVSQITAGTIDYAGTDAPLSQEKCDQLNLDQFHMVSGAVVPVIHLKGVNALTLTGDVLASIYLGEITRWNDPRLVKLNPSVTLPNTKITVVHRGDGSGTTHIFSTYLATVSPQWKEQVGISTLLKWPCGIAGQKNPGICNNVRRINGSIGYVEYTFALEAKLTIANLQVENVVRTPEQSTWPILGKTYILTRRDAPLEKKKALKAYFNWCFEKGGPTAVRLHYIPCAQKAQ